jgi:hypothetical protein
VVWADACVHSTGKTKSSATIAALSSPVWLHIATKTERIERSDAAMARTIPFPQTPVFIFEVDAQQSRCTDFHPCRLPFVGRQTTGNLLYKGTTSLTKRLLCELPSTDRNHGIIIHILEGFQTPGCHDAMDYTNPAYFDELYGCTRVIWGCIALANRMENKATIDCLMKHSAGPVSESLRSGKKAWCWRFRAGLTAR